MHQKCYELQRIPVGDWICALCRAFGPKGKLLRCPLCTRRGGVMKSTEVDIARPIFEGANPGYSDFQRRCAEYYRTHSPEAFEDNLSEDLSLELKNEDSYEEKLYYNFQTLRDIPGKLAGTLG